MSKGKERKMKSNDGKMRWRPGMMLGVAVALVVSALVLGACGGSSGGSSSSESTTTASSGSGSQTSGGEGGTETQGGPGGFAAISEEQRSCLKEKGVELPEFKSGEGGPPMGENGEPPEGFEPPEGGEGGKAGEPPEGFEPPAGGEMPQGGNFAENEKAFEECGVELGELKGGPAGKRPNVDSAAFKKQVKEYVACVRENGYELAEPDFSGEGPIFEISES
jgi:hypothetical protein